MTKDLERSSFIRSSKQLGNALKQIRKKRGYSQNELAKLTGLRQAGISLLEQGAKGIRLESLFKIMAALEIEITLDRRAKLPW